VHFRFFLNRVYPTTHSVQLDNGQLTTTTPPWPECVFVGNDLQGMLANRRESSTELAQLSAPATL